MINTEVFVHRLAIVDSDSIGPGTRIWPFAHVCPGAVIGARCNVGETSFIEGGAKIGNDVTIKNGVMIWEGVTIADGVFIGPGVVFTNDFRPRARGLARDRYATKKWLIPTAVHAGVAIGANATVGAGITIGEFAMVGAGSVVTRDVPPYGLVMGNPARLRGFVCACGEKLPAPADTGDSNCSSCGARFHKSGQGLIRLA